MMLRYLMTAVNVIKEYKYEVGNLAMTHLQGPAIISLPESQRTINLYQVDVPSNTFSLEL